MKNLRRPLTVAIILGVASCAVIITLRSFAQTPAASGPNDITINGWQKLKSPWDEDADGYRDKILCKNATAFYVTHHRKSDGKESKHDKTKCSGHADASESSIMPVANPIKSTPSAPTLAFSSAGANVTQQISCLDPQAKLTVLSTFDTSP